MLRPFEIQKEHSPVVETPKRAKEIPITNEIPAVSNSVEKISNATDNFKIPFHEHNPNRFSAKASSTVKNHKPGFSLSDNLKRMNRFKTSLLNVISSTPKEKNIAENFNTSISPISHVLNKPSNDEQTSSNVPVTSKVTNCKEASYRKYNRLKSNEQAISPTGEYVNGTNIETNLEHRKKSNNRIDLSEKEVRVSLINTSQLQIQDSPPMTNRSSLASAPPTQEHGNNFLLADWTDDEDEQIFIEDDKQTNKQEDNDPHSISRVNLSHNPLAKEKSIIQNEKINGNCKKKSDTELIKNPKPSNIEAASTKTPTRQINAHSTIDRRKKVNRPNSANKHTIFDLQNEVSEGDKRESNVEEKEIDSENEDNNSLLENIPFEAEDRNIINISVKPIVQTNALTPNKPKSLKRKSNEIPDANEDNFREASEKTESEYNLCGDNIISNRGTTSVKLLQSNAFEKEAYSSRVPALVEEMANHKTLSVPIVGQISLNEPELGTSSEDELLIEDDDNSVSEPTRSNSLSTSEENYEIPVKKRNKVVEKGNNTVNHTFDNIKASKKVTEKQNQNSKNVADSNLVKDSDSIQNVNGPKKPIQKKKQTRVAKTKTLGNVTSRTVKQIVIDESITNDDQHHYSSNNGTIIFNNSMQNSTNIVNTNEPARKIQTSKESQRTENSLLDTNYAGDSDSSVSNFFNNLEGVLVNSRGPNTQYEEDSTDVNDDRNLSINPAIVRSMLKFTNKTKVPDIPTFKAPDKPSKNKKKKSTNRQNKNPDVEEYFQNSQNLSTQSLTLSKTGGKVKLFSQGSQETIETGVITQPVQSNISDRVASIRKSIQIDTLPNSITSKQTKSPKKKSVRPLKEKGIYEDNNFRGSQVSLKSSSDIKRKRKTLKVSKEYYNPIERIEEIRKLKLNLRNFAWKYIYNNCNLLTADGVRRSNRSRRLPGAYWSSAGRNSRNTVSTEKDAEPSRHVDKSSKRKRVTTPKDVVLQVIEESEAENVDQVQGIVTARISKTEKNSKNLKKQSLDMAGSSITTRQNKKKNSVPLTTGAASKSEISRIEQVNEQGNETLYVTPNLENNRCPSTDSGVQSVGIFTIMELKIFIILIFILKESETIIDKILNHNSNNLTSQQMSYTVNNDIYSKNCGLRYI